MSMAYIRKHYSRKAKRGARVEYTGECKPQQGTITGAEGAPQPPGGEVANKCAQCKKVYFASKNSVGCLKCAPGKAIDEAEFIKPIT